MDATKLIKTSSSFWANSWVDGGSSDGYYYYATGTTLNKFEKTATTPFVELFATDAKFIIEGAGFTGADNNGESGGFKIDETTSINKIEVYLTLETLQGDATAEQAEALGWEITTGGTEGEKDVELTPEDYTSTTTTDDTTGEEKTIYTPSETFVGKNPKYVFTFSLNDTDKTATITGPVGKPTELDIPSKLIVKGQDYTTTSIGQKASYSCSGLTKITIPDSVTSIGESAFYNCWRLTSIEIPDSVTSIGSNAFEKCSGLKSVTIGSGVTSIGQKAFYSCSGLTSITILDSVTSIGDYTFQDCSGLTSVTIGSGVTSIGESIFFCCSGLTSINVDSKNPKYHSAGNCLIETKSSTLIAGCKNSEIPTDGSVTSIGRQAFAGCSGLTSITIPNSVTSIDTQAFWLCSGLEEIKVAEGNVNYHSAGNCLIETTSKTLIAGCKNSEIPTDGSVTSIRESAFYNCSGLTSITIPNSVTYIGYNEFYGCSGLTTVTIDSATIAGLGSSDSKLLDNATKVYVKSDITTVGSYITGSFEKAATSDKDGYDMYTKKA